MNNKQKDYISMLFYLRREQSRLSKTIDLVKRRIIEQHFSKNVGDVVVCNNHTFVGKKMQIQSVYAKDDFLHFIHRKTKVRLIAKGPIFKKNGELSARSGEYVETIEIDFDVDIDISRINDVDQIERAVS